MCLPERILSRITIAFGSKTGKVLQIRSMQLNSVISTSNCGESELSGTEGDPWLPDCVGPDDAVCTSGGAVLVPVGTVVPLVDWGDRVTIACHGNEPQ